MVLKIVGLSRYKVAASHASRVPLKVTVLHITHSPCVTQMQRQAIWLSDSNFQMADSWIRDLARLFVWQTEGLRGHID